MNLKIQRTSWGASFVFDTEVADQQESGVALFMLNAHQTPQEADARAQFFIAAWAMRDLPEFQLLAKRFGVDLSQVTP
jgi:hypothetical protein